MALARTHNSDLAAAAARVGGARADGSSRALSNPLVGYSGNQTATVRERPDNKAVHRARLRHRRKLKIAREAARHGITAADWHAASKWFDTVARVKAAYYEYATALASCSETGCMETLSFGSAGRTEKLATGGRVDAYDVSRLKVEVTQVANRVGAARQRSAAAERMLAVAVGGPDVGRRERIELADAAKVPAFGEAVRSPAILPSYGPSPGSRAARLEVRQAEVKPIPNIKTLTTVAHDYVTRAPMASVMVGLPLPAWDRNQGTSLLHKRASRPRPPGSNRPASG